MHSKYWMVHQRGTKTLDTREIAEDEAKRLAKMQPGTTFFVLEVVTGFEVKFPQPEEVEIERSNND